MIQFGLVLDLPIQGHVHVANDENSLKPLDPSDFVFLEDIEEQFAGF